MNKVTFKTYKVGKIDFVNALENGTRVEFENKYSYNVRFAQNSTCVGEFNVDIADKTVPDKFHIKASVLGIFTYKEGLKKEVVHVETYKELFPYVRAMVQNLTVNAGIPPIVLPAIDIEQQSIYKYEKNSSAFKPDELL